MEKENRTCWDCQYGSHLPKHEETASDKDMFCRLFLGSVDKRIAAECPSFERVKRIGF